MSYDSYEISPHDGAPLEGYFFQGTVASYRYTNAQKDISINGLLYTAASIRRNAIKSGTHEDDSLELELEMPFNLQMVKDYAYSASLPDLSLTVYRYHEDSDPLVDWTIVWVGKVTAWTVANKKAKLRIPNIFEIVMRGSVPAVFYQSPCNNVLYDARCKVIKSTFTQVTDITSVSSNLIGVTNDGFADNFLRAGELYIPARGERRLIVDNVANLITVDFPFFEAQIGDDVELYAGCDHAYQGDCKNKYNNTLNYTGFPYVPNDNPFEQTDI